MSDTVSIWHIFSLVPVLFLPFGIASCHARPLVPPPSATETSPVSVPPPLIAATLAGDLEDVRSLLQANTDPNTIYNTNTALTYAARDGFTDIAQLLIDAGADVNWIDGEGVTPLILASLKGHTELAMLLLDHGADKIVVDQWNRTALDYALRRGPDDPIVQMLQAQ